MADNPSCFLCGNKSCTLINPNDDAVMDTDLYPLGITDKDYLCSDCTVVLMSGKKLSREKIRSELIEQIKRIDKLDEADELKKKKK